MAAYSRATASGLSRAGAHRVRVGRGQGRHQAPGHRGRLRRECPGKIRPHRQRGPQQVRGQHERQRGLAVVAARGQHHGRPRRPRGFGPELGDQPGLPAARLPGDRHHPPRGAGRLPGGAQGGQFGLPAHQRPDTGRLGSLVDPARCRLGAGHPGRGGPRLRGPRHRRCRTRRRRPQPPGPHIVVQPGRLGQRPDGQVPVQHADQRPVLPHRGRTLPGPAVQPDDRLVGGFVQRIELQPAPRMPGRALQIALRGARRHQPLQPARERLAQPLAHRVLPLLEVGAAAQDEAGQEVVPVQLDRPLQGLGVRARDQSLELPHVHLNRGQLEGDGRPADGQARRPWRPRSPTGCAAARRGPWRCQRPATADPRAARGCARGPSRRAAPAGRWPSWCRR